jgi:hypothetical protein
MPGEERAGLVVTLFGDRASLVRGVAEELAAALQASSQDVVLHERLESDAPIDANGLASELLRLRSAHEIVVVAMEGPFRDEALVAFDRSDRVLVVTDGRVASARAARRLLKLTTTLGFGVDRLAVVLVEPGATALDPLSLNAALQRDVLAVLPAGASPEQRHRFGEALVRNVLDGLASRGRA